MKHAAIVVALMAGSAAIGYYVGVLLTKKKSRVNTRVKLSTDKVLCLFG